jgi:endonuclease/exonuclease/phosphatase (EEP) superfamily protein YafD
MRQFSHLINTHLDTPTIIGGDFNDTPQSFAYQVIVENMKDCFIESGNGIGGTYVGPLPSFRIDYILHDTTLKSFNYTTLNGFGSDHKMIETIIALK